MPMLLRRTFFALAIAFTLAGCASVKFVADYDEKIEQGVTEIQRKVETILGKIDRSKAKPSASYDAKDYQSIKEDLNVLRTRAASGEKNDITLRMLYVLGYALLEDPAVPFVAGDLAAASAKAGGLNLALLTDNAPPPPANRFSLERRHKLPDPTDDETLRDIRALLELHFRSLLSFELAKKRSKDGTAAQ
jgi:hypothetical protein